jgi:hypothetical protein
MSCAGCGGAGSKSASYLARGERRCIGATGGICPSASGVVSAGGEASAAGRLHGQLITLVIVYFVEVKVNNNAGMIV